ncbi:hypothetical protein PR202_gb24270 [Eleusine coracana subsp. coracana]|uniref:F-box domain-containing protein n=1 Tax=Eleusine coracana subsp. coracana TaxID=191504 RepID=A0AAV5FLL3_ELECO|nr:hypothetical protein PR202_gb24270 [Eleusine coracana subsp. coracana]
MSSPPASRRDGAPAELTLLPDEILEDIFLLLESGYDLARAFRRVATGRPFLRRFLSLHPPPVVGLTELGSIWEFLFYLVEPPQPHKLSHKPATTHSPSSPTAATATASTMSAMAASSLLSTPPMPPPS